MPLGGSNDGPSSDDVLNQAAQNQLRSIISRVERLEEEKAEIAEGVKEVYAEAKGNGFDVKILRKIVRLRKMDPNKVAEEEALVDLYRHAIEGPDSKTPAGDEPTGDEDPDDIG